MKHGQSAELNIGGPVTSVLRNLLEQSAVSDLSPVLSEHCIGSPLHWSSAGYLTVILPTKPNQPDPPIFTVPIRRLVLVYNTDTAGTKLW